MSPPEHAPRRERRSRRAGGRLFAPGRRVLAELGLVQKFGLVLVILAMPLAFITWGYLSGEAHDRRFTDRELAGTEVLTASVDVLVATVGDADGRVDPATLTAARNTLDDAIARHGQQLDVSGEWAATRAALDDVTATPGSERRSSAVAQLRRFLVTVGDRSNLTLDPELDTYYLMDASQYRYPALIDISAEAAAELAGMPASDLDGRWTGVRDLARVVTVELDSLSSGLATAARETADADHAADIRARAADAMQRVDAIDAALERAPDAAAGSARIRAALDALPTTTELTTDWRASLDLLQHLLDVRRDRMVAANHRFLAAAAVCVAIAGYLLLSLFSGLLRSLRAMRCVLVRAGDGDLTAAVEPMGSDELADVSRAINDTVARVAAAQAELERRATHDGLTGLPNRERFVEVLQERIAGASSSAPVAIAFVDLDSFKAVNDLHGHHNGDHVLRVTAERLTEATPPGSVCARLAGDEYAVLVAPGLSRDAVRDAMHQVLGAISRPIQLPGEQGRVVVEGASLGLAFHDGSDPLDAEGLLAAADFAMYEAKTTAPGLVREFTSELAAAVRRRATMRTELSRALTDPAHTGFSVAYQPIVDLANTRIVGSEALARWTHPQLGVVSPLEFVPLAESTGLIGALGQFVLGDAARQLARGQRHVPELFTSVNVSALALSDGLLEWHLEQATTDADVQPPTFWLELTESAMMTDPRGAARKIASIRRRGHPVAIDDFGTGYSSLSYLHSLELSALKVDRSFVSSLDVVNATTQHHILHMTLDLARHLGLDVIAEGIETIDQLDALRHLGVERGQGFLFHRPMSADSFIALVTSRPRTPVSA